jgi:hypothetical protein
MGQLPRDFNILQPISARADNGIAAQPENWQI